VPSAAHTWMRHHSGSAMRKRWLVAALLVGFVYFVIGRAFARPTTHVQFWRLAAWVTSGIAYAGQIAYEHFQLRSSPGSLAFHAAVAAAIGAFALALGGFIHSIGGPAPRHLWYLALVVWPLVTFAPAFIVALVLAIVLGRIAPRTDA
jgi:hypothetical protein